MTRLTWLHISDWHQKERDFDRKVVRVALINDIKNRVAIDPCLDKIDFAVFSGDVAFSGKPEEYEIAKEELLEPLLKACNLSSERLFIVPGNHDLDISKFELLPAPLLKPLESDIEAKKWLFDSERRVDALKPFKAFTSFVNQYTKQQNSDYSNIRLWEIDGKRIALLGINSAWMCGRRKNSKDKIDDKGVVVVGEPQIHDPLESISDSDIKIAVLHHPFDWLADFESNQIMSRLMKKCDFILHGHQHEQRVAAIRSTYGNCIVIPVGACYDRRIYTNSYNFVHLDFESEKGIVFLRCWNGRDKWREDIDSCSGGKFEFRSHVFVNDCISSYCSSLIRDLSLWRGLGSFSNKNLKQIYVPHLLIDKSQRGMERTDPAVLQSLLDCTADRPNVLVEGNAGSGKTMLLRNWAVTLAQSRLESKSEGYIPIYLPLGWLERVFGKGPWNKSPIELAAERYPDVIGRASEPLVMALTDAVQSNRVVILLDALDEISEPALPHFLDWWNRTRVSSAHCPIVLTSRPRTHTDGVSAVNKLYVRAFNTQQIKTFIANWFGGNDQANITALQTHLQRSFQLQAPDVAGNPLFLTMMCVEFEKSGKLSATPGKLLDQFVRLLLEAWDVQQGVQHASILLDLKLQVLESVATHFFELNRGKFSDRELFDYTRKFLYQIGSPVLASDIIDEIVKRSGLLVEDCSGDYQFCHDLFLEYFVARDKAFGLSENGQESWLQEIFLEPRYEKVIQFYQDLKFGG